MIEQPRSMPAVAYRTLWERLAEMRTLDPDNRELLRLARQFSRIGRRAGAVHATSETEGEDLEARRSGASLDPGFAWERLAIPLSPEDAAIVERVAQITVVPE